MRKIKWYINTGFAQCKFEGEIEVNDNATDEEIEEIVAEEALSCIDIGYEEVE